MAARRRLRSAARSVLDLVLKAGGQRRPTPRRASPDRSRRRAAAPFPDVEYRPRDDDAADPGEIVWAWVPYDEGDGRGKDRPVLVIGRRGDDLLGLMLSSQDHDRDAADEARHGRVWTDLGTGAWDARGRPSEVRLDRLLQLAPRDVRREGAALDRARFDRVVAEARRVQGW
ncbi:type II toxin-antitoxin system PemK/MazF family toxin [Blastococcus goldschmidtiae]|uniref:Type II toxin-antitoxin system PemK/MazF family toxin n=1 Tax=Blastococcus goldschmidtiae TaxID=3075546 RepID=A0ABU2KBD6_9ACTN|nr:type II toxin-antitoxin system PemK/MazF family toxin [Blastococcus sp. DSM 46792]MDT0277500.1 type II toxin-antitoxin system PemK/MazF family toxin [Blastococcus sp. DSM 46792]